MLFDGIKLVEGSEINNLVVQTGTSYPSLPSEGELFYMREGGSATEGLYVYDGAQWLMTNNDFAMGDIIAGLGYTPANVAGDTFTGPVILSGSPSQALEAATKGYVDATAGAVGSAAQPLDADLTAIAALSSTGLARRTGANTWTLDTNAYLTGNQSITFSGDASGSGATSVTLTLAASGVAAGSYGTASSVGTVNVDAKGRITSASNTPIAIDANQVSTGSFANARIAQANVTQHQAALTIAETQITDGALLARNAGNETITGTWAFSVAPTSPNPTTGSQVANKDYVDNIAAGVSPQRSVKVASTANISLSGLQTIDAYSVQAGDRVLVKDQSVGSQNGVYVAAAGTWARASDFDGSPTNEVSSGALVYVETGTANGNSSWVLVTPDPITIGTTALSFSIFSRPGDFVAGAGMTKTGNQFDIGTASSARIVVNADSIDLATAGTPGTYTSVTTDTYGRVTAGTNPGFLTANQNITVSGDATGSGTTAISLVLSASGVAAGTYNNSATQHNAFTVDAKGRVTNVGAATTITPAFSSITGKPSNLSGYGITDAVLKTGDTMTGTLTISTASTPIILLNTTTDAFQAVVTFGYNSLSRWRVGKLNNAETGSNVGSDFNIGRYNDAGTYVDSPLTINRASGLTTLSSLNVNSDISASGKLLLGTGQDISWGGTYATGKPTISATSNTISIFPTGNVNGAVVTVGGTSLSVTAATTIQLPSAGSFVGVRGAATSSANLVVQSNQSSGTAWWITAKNSGSLEIGGTGGTEPATGAISIGGGTVTIPGTLSNRGGRAAVVNPTTPLDGDIQVSGAVVSIYASGAWRQVFPAVYS